MRYSFSYYHHAADAMSAESSGQGSPYDHEFGPLLHGETRCYDPRIDRWVSEEPIQLEQYSKDTFPQPSIFGSENTHNS